MRTLSIPTDYTASNRPTISTSSLTTYLSTTNDPESWGTSHEGWSQAEAKRHLHQIINHDLEVEPGRICSRLLVETVRQYADRNAWLCEADRHALLQEVHNILNSA